MPCKLICNDALIALKKIKSMSIHASITDPPYGVHINDSWDKEIPPPEIWKELYRVLMPGSHCAIFAQPSMLADMILIMLETDFEYRDTWIWSYQGTHTKGFKLETENGLFRSRIRNIYNPVLIYRKPIEGTEKENWDKYKTNLFNIDECREPYKGNHTTILKRFKETGEKHMQSDTKSNTFGKLKQKGWVPDERGAEPVNIQYVPRASKIERTANGRIDNPHETVKPISIMKWLVGLLTSTTSQTVIDPFMGTGSTGCACKLLDRQFVGIEINKATVGIAQVRIDNTKADVK